MKRNVTAAGVFLAFLVLAPITAHASAEKAQHPGDLGRRHRRLEHQPHEPRHDGLQDAQHRPHRQGRHLLHDYYGQQSCTAGRAAFLNGSVPVRTGMTKVGLPAAPQGWQKTDVTFAGVLKGQGYATGQFGKNHQGDRDEHLPTQHGFDEFMGNLYHLNAEEEPEDRDYPADMKLADGSTFREKFGPRGVIKATADGKIEDTGPLTKKRMETVDEETLAAAKDFIQRQHKAGKPWMCWWNGTRMHFRTHVKEEHTGIAGKTGSEYHDGMVEHDLHVGELLALIDELGIADNTIVQYSTDNGVHYNTWPDAGTTPFHGEKNSNWEGAFRVPCYVRWPGKFPAGATVNGIVSHEDWLPTFAAAAGNPNIKDQLREGVELIGRTYKNYIDGYNMLDYLKKAGTFKTIDADLEACPRKEFIYTTDGGEVCAIRVHDWKATYLEERATRLQIWREPFIKLRTAASISICAAIPSRRPRPVRTPTMTGTWTRYTCWPRCRSSLPSSS